MRVKDRMVAYGAVGILAALLSLWATVAIYRSDPVTADENSYIFQAHCFAEGLMRRPFPDLDRAVWHFMLIMDREHGWLSRYPPGHALWLTPGIWLGHPRIMVMLAAGLGAVLLCAAARQAGLSLWAVAVPLLLSPYFINLFGTLLSHTSGFMFSSALLAAYLAWRRTHQRRYACMAGLAWSWLFLNRTYTAGLIALPFGLDALTTGVRHYRNRRVLAGVLLFAGAAVLGVLLFYGYNKAAVGTTRVPTFLFYEPSEGLGFGLRHTQRRAVLHTPQQGFRYLWENVVSLNQWLWGFRGSLVAALALAGIGWRKNYSPVLLGAVGLVWLGYVGFWFQGIPDVGGPVYYVETLPFLLLLTGLGLQRAHAWLRLRVPGGRWVFPALAFLVGGHALFFLGGEMPRLREPREKSRALRKVLNSAPPNAMVFIQHIDILRHEEVVFNPRGLQSDPLIVHSQGAANPWAMRFHPERMPFLFDGRNPDRLVPLEVADTLPAFEWEAADMPCQVGTNVTDEEGHRFRTARQGTAEGFVALGRRLPLTPGRYRARFQVYAGPEGGRIRLDVVAVAGRLVLAEQDLDLAPNAGGWHVLDVDVVQPVWSEPRVRYLGQGDVRVGRITLEETR